jgi:hypothetical protein
VQFAQLSPWLGAELSDERAAGLLIGGECFALAAVVVQGQHQQRVQAFAQRVRAGRAGAGGFRRIRGRAAETGQPQVVKK